MAELFARVDLIQDDETLSLDIDQVAGGYEVQIERARPVVAERDGTGARVLVYPIGSDFRVLSISGTSDRLRLPPSLADLDLDDDIEALVTWGDSTTTTRLLGRTSGLERIDSDLLAGSCAWSLTVEGTITEGLDPVTGETIEPEEPPAP